MEREGFEPPNPKERIYSPPRLASSLPFLIIELMARDGIEPPTHGASIHCSTNWATEPNCGSRIWTYDLRVMSPTSYRAAPSRVNFKEDVGFEPTHAFTRLTVFKTVPFSRTWVILQYNIVRTGFEPVLPPWKGGVLTPWPTDHTINGHEWTRTTDLTLIRRAL